MLELKTKLKFLVKIELEFMTFLPTELTPKPMNTLKIRENFVIDGCLVL